MKENDLNGHFAHASQSNNNTMSTNKKGSQITLGALCTRVLKNLL